MSSTAAGFVMQSSLSNGISEVLRVPDGLVDVEQPDPKTPLSIPIFRRWQLRALVLPTKREDLLPYISIIYDQLIKYESKCKAIQTLYPKKLTREEVLQHNGLHLTPAPSSMPNFHDARIMQPPRSAKLQVVSPSHPHALEDATQAGPLRVESSANIYRSSSPGVYDTQPSQLDDHYGSPLCNLARDLTQKEVGKEKHFLSSPKVSSERKEARERLQQAFERLVQGPKDKITLPLESSGSSQTSFRHKNSRKSGQNSQEQKGVNYSRL